MRTPTIPPPDVVKRPDTKYVTEVRRYKVITPLFGGGVTPGEADPITVVRATEVRGHLRFWWRATRGGQFNGDLTRMKAAEELIWGSAGDQDKPGPSEVSVVVSDASSGSVRQKVEIQTNRGTRQVGIGEASSPFSYVASPLGLEQGKPAGSVRDNVEFTLTIKYPRSQSEDVAAALWAWETFGGIGARTRRGFGALECTLVDGVSLTKPTVGSVTSEIEAGLTKHVGNGTWHRDCPHLLRAMKIAPSNGKTSAEDAWKFLFDSLKKFRQARHPDAQGRPYGRSKWPEPDTIRDITGDSAPKHSQRRLLFNKFPRAAFELPIVFQFKDSGLGDPEQTSLEGAEHDRLASPLILRPLACAGGRYVGLAVILHAPVLPPGGLRLKGAPGNPTVNAGLTRTEAQAIHSLNGNIDVLQAFLDWL